MFLEIHDLKKSFGSGNNRTEVLKGIEFTANKGEICVLLGPSGSGKSTLLNIIGGIDSPDDGYVAIEGEKMKDMTEKALTRYRRRHLGYIFQMYNLIPNLTVRENIEVGAYLSDRALDVDELLHTLGLYEHQRKLPNQLSGGMLQRIMIGIAMALQPELLIADEPTTAIDAVTQYEILEEFVRIKKNKNTAMLFITHDLGAISKVADRILVMNSGQIVDSGDFEHIRNHANDPYTRLLIEKRSAVMCHYRDILHGKEISHA